MALLSFSEYKIASGHNNTAGYVAFEEITAGGNKLQPAHVNWPHSRNIDGDAISRRNGTFTAEMPTPLFYQLWATLKSTYEGKVTVRLPSFDDADTFQDYNAVLDLGLRPERVGNYYAGFILTFNKVVAI